MKILVVDNYDSFTYNLVQYLGELGADLLVWRNDRYSPDDVAAADPDGIVISPGPCTPNEAGLSVETIRRFGAERPILGVCLGHQAIGAAYGAEVVRAPSIMHGKTSRISHDGTGPFRGLPDGLSATRYHSLIVRNPPPELIVNAWTDDGADAGGERIIMGLRHAEHPVWGVQFHPESVLTEGGMTMLGTFLASL